MIRNCSRKTQRDVKAKTGYQKVPDKKIKDIDEFKKFLEANCDKAGNCNKDVFEAYLDNMLTKEKN